MEELAFEDVQIFALQLLAVAEVLYLDFQHTVLVLDLPLLDMDLVDRRTHKCNQLKHLDLSKSVHKLYAHLTFLVIN